ncbi:MAG: DUF4331 domain-containing protein, partial [Vicinamibacterales bacterium]
MKKVLLVLAVSLSGSWWVGTDASSHREAPLISGDPRADNTDVYAFVSPDRPDTVTIVANYIPLEEPAGGPNFNSFDDHVLYEIHVDNDGDAKDNITYQFRFRTKIRNPDTFLYNTGPIDSLSDPDWNMPQTYQVTEINGRQRRTLGRNLPTSPVNIGPRSIPDYGVLRTEAIQSLPNDIKVFAGQADDPFFVDLGSVFDLAGLRPFNSLHVIPLLDAAGVDGVGGFNTHAIVIQVPIAHLTRDRQLPTGPTDPDAVLGIYASASRPRLWIDEDEHDDDDRDAERQYVQVSRLGNPLINEVVIPLGQKDRWNQSDPDDDARFVGRYTSPEVTRLENALYPILDDAPETQRGDLVAILLTGVPGLNFTGNTRADLLRLNVGIPPTAPVGTGNRLGVLAGDFAGFPNGRRLEDDVTDIDLRAFACGYGTVVGPLIESFGFCAGNANRTPNNILGDGVDVNDRPFSVDFPYVGIPHQ